MFKFINGLYGEAARFIYIFFIKQLPFLWITWKMLLILNNMFELFSSSDYVTH